jgi:DNA ligase D-like protein (predicted 3'-phosphoesterase)/DNA ligase D-like protein (predicted polymerase)
MDKMPHECRRERPTTGIQPMAFHDDTSMPGHEVNPQGLDQSSMTPKLRKTTEALDPYRAMRDFEQTPEPPPTLAPTAPREGHQPIFVVQEHHASRLHYDFRLEAEGVLKSWAVPKAPSMDPAQKRLAIHVEDHPLAYATFTGTIPAGQYGAGTVTIWDHGTYDHMHADQPSPQTVTESIEAGQLALTLHGTKLQGQFALVRMHGQGRGKEPWLLIKKQDALARPEGRMGVHARERESTKSKNPRSRTSSRAPKKRTPDFYPEWIQRVLLPSEDGTEVPYVLVNDQATLLYLVNQGTLTFHVGFSQIADLDRPDCVLFDLDPGQAGMADVVAVAKALHRRLQAERHQAFVKTSGKTGLHVLVPWERTTEYAEVRAWALGIAQQVVDALPDHATTERSKAKRGTRVYVDVLQNAKGHHAVPPYVLRAVPGAPVSTPLHWRELTPHLDPTVYNLKTIFRRLAGQQHDPMSGLLRVVTRAP